MRKNSKSTPLQVYVPAQMKSDVETFAGRIGATASSYVRQAIAEKLTRDQKQAA